MFTPGADMLGASRSKSLGPRELNHATACAAALSRTTSVSEPRRTVTGSAWVVAKLCSASPAACVTLTAGIVVVSKPDGNTGGPGCRSNRTTALAPALAALFTLTVAVQVPNGISAIAPAKPPAG